MLLRKIALPLSNNGSALCVNGRTKLLEEMGVEMVYEEYYDEDGRLYQWETCIQPDVYVHMDIEDLRQGKDTVIEWVLAQ